MPQEAMSVPASEAEASSNNNVAAEADEAKAPAEVDTRPIVSEERFNPHRKEIREGDPGSMTGRPLRLYADGIFDMFHFGHGRMLEQCKKSFPNVYLLVGCCSDEMTNANKGRTVLRDYERYESLRHCKWVDEVVPDAPWVLTNDFLERHQIDFVCHDALPYADASGEAENGGDIYANIKKMGKFLETERTQGISTTDLITRIIKQYDIYVKRNFDRGYTGRQMNVPFIKEQSIRLDMAMTKVKANVDNTLDRLTDTTEQVVAKTEEVVDFLQRGFLDIFDKRGPLRTGLRKRRQELSRQISDFAKSSPC